MNKYDDIKQFKEKLGLEHIDYKDTSENNVHLPSQEWAILKQVAGENGNAADNAAPPGKGRLPASPVPVSKEEFRSPSLLQAVSRQLPAGRESTTDRATGTPQPETVSTSASADPAPDYPDDQPRFRRLFRHKNVSVEDNDKRRNTPLKPLLESIALCR
ncbi:MULTISPECIES: cellulose biosynthesis protein BcsO [unclassified Brenneria]|uniref:cellulose biosynthesis protein BcsO n=1 Tax=unclassified Brenneria TaxID=2634434 RepID=UPI0029C516EB|nr:MULTISPECIES: cellulose biosynthesis protein BcsO [unclassified Brenneria]MDX5628127.1 cellulose biosynthesis protein BcsO [Brenneria sp. L3-3Z]MDX5694853.1 cellulose biosynthesis protein BcsO [Brenneria sp. L4-2C]MEE3660642.1 cellulose biosynthesis protein BcsO [Brenneria sp. g21c3]